MSRGTFSSWTINRTSKSSIEWFVSSMKCLSILQVFFVFDARSIILHSWLEATCFPYSLLLTFFTINYVYDIFWLTIYILRDYIPSLSYVTIKIITLSFQVSTINTNPSTIITIIRDNITWIYGINICVSLLLFYIFTSFSINYLKILNTVLKHIFQFFIIF